MQAQFVAFVEVLVAKDGGDVVDQPPELERLELAGLAMLGEGRLALISAFLYILFMPCTGCGFPSQHELLYRLPPLDTNPAPE